MEMRKRRRASGGRRRERDAIVFSSRGMQNFIDKDGKQPVTGAVQPVRRQVGGGAAASRYLRRLDLPLTKTGAAESHGRNEILEDKDLNFFFVNGNDSPAPSERRIRSPEH